MVCFFRFWNAINVSDVCLIVCFYITNYKNNKNIKKETKKEQKNIDNDFI